MRSLTLLKTTRACSSRLVIGAGFFLFSMSSFGQVPMAPMPQNATASGQNSQADQIAELRAQIAKLQAAMQQAGSKKRSDAMPGMKMGHGKAMNMPSMDDKGEMGAMAPQPAMPASAGAMKDNKSEMGGMPVDAQSSASAAPAPAMGMCCMGKMGGGSAKMAGAAPQPAAGMAGMSGSSSAMPGRLGASHLYHIGSTGFFLNHSNHITLTDDQRMTLNRFQDKAMLDRESAQGRIDQAEQELYNLTGADQPSTSKIQAKVTAIEKLRADQRMNFIRAVGEATAVLSSDQRLVLLGTVAGNQK